MNSILRIPLVSWSCSALLILISIHHFAVSAQAQVVPVPGTFGDWNVNAAGNWSDAGNWTGLDGGTDYPSGIGATAIVVHAIGADRIITLDVDVTLGTLRLGDNNNTHDFFITGSNTLTFDNGGSGALLDHNNQTSGLSPTGGDRIDVSVNLNDNLVIDLNRNIEFRGLWSGTGGETLTLQNSNPSGIKNDARAFWQGNGQNGGLTNIDVLNIINGEARFDGTAGGTVDQQVIGANTINLGNGILQTDSDVFPRLFLVNTESTQTAELNVNGGWLISDLGTDDRTIWSGDINFTGAANTNLFDVNDAGGANGDEHTVTGAIGGTGGFSKINTGTLELTGNNTIAGDIYIQRGGVGGAGIDSTTSRGSVRLSGADGAFSGGTSASSVILSRDGSLYLDNSAVANGNRFGDDRGLTLRGEGRLRLIGSSADPVSEDMGALLQDSASGKVNISLQGGDNASSPLTTLAFDSYTRNVGTISQFQVLENFPGAFGSPTGGNAQLFFGTQAGTSQLGGGGTNTSATVASGWSSTNRDIVVGTFGGVNNVSNHFMTFDSLNPTELRPLVWNGTADESEYFLSREGLTTPHQFTVAGLGTFDQNVNINFNTGVEAGMVSIFDDEVVPAEKGKIIPTGLGGGYGWFGNAPVAILENVAMNSLRFGTNTPTVNVVNSGTAQNVSNEIGSALVLAPGARLYLGDKVAGPVGDPIPAITTSGSGMILFGRDVDGTNPGSNQYIAGGYLDFGTREAIIVNESGNSALLRSNIVGSGGLTKAGANTVYLDNSNSYSGDTNIAEGVLVLRDQNALGASTRVNIEGSGRLYLELGTNVRNTTVSSTPPDLFVGTISATNPILYSNGQNNSWDGNVIIDTVDDAGNWIYTARIAVNARDTLNINGNIYGNENANPISTSIVLNDARRVSTFSTNNAGGVINLNGQFSDTATGTVIDPVTSANENQVLRFQVGGSNDLVVNVRQPWNAAGLISVEQGIMRYEGTGNFWTDSAAAAINAGNGQSGFRLGGNDSAASVNNAFILTKANQVLNISRIDIGAQQTSDNANNNGNIMLAGTNTTGTVTFGNGTDRVVYGNSDSTRAHTRDLTLYAAGGGTVDLNFRLDDPGNNVFTSFTKIGRGVVNYNGQTGTTNGDVEQLNMSGGLLRLTNYGGAQGRRFDNGAMLVMAGGGIEMDASGSIANEVAQYTGAAVAINNAATTPTPMTIVAPGGTDVIVTAAPGFTATMNIGSTAIPLTRQKGGTVNFVENSLNPGAAISLQGDGTGQIQLDDTAYAWATFGDTYNFDAGTASYTLNALDFAMTTGGAGDLAAFAGANRQDSDDVALWTTGFDVSEDLAGFNGGLAVSPVNTIHFDFDGAGSIDATNGLEVSSGGIMVSSGVLTGVKSIDNGSLNAGIDTDLIVHQYGGAAMTIGSVIQDNAGSTVGVGNALVKTGSGELILTGTNTYTGGTYLNGGQLTVSDNLNLGATPGVLDEDNIYANGGTLRVLSDVALDVNRGMTLGGNGIEISVGPASTLIFNGVIASEPNIIPNYTANPAVGRIDKTGLGTLTISELNNTYSGLTEVKEGTLRWNPLGPNGSATYNPFGTNTTFLDGTIVRSGATLAIHPETELTSSNRTFTINEWFTFEGGSYLDVAPTSNATTPHDFNLNLRGVLFFDSLGNSGTLDGFVTPESLAGTTIIDVGRRDLRLNDDGGYLTGDGGITKTGDSALSFRENNPEWTGQLVVLEGQVYVYGAGNVLGTGTLPIILGHNLLAEQAGEVVSGNTAVQLLVFDEGGYRDVATVSQDIIVRSDEGAGNQTKRIGARNLANIDEVNYDGNITLRDSLELFYQDDARDSENLGNSSQISNSTRSIGTLTNMETVFININGNITGAVGNNLITNVAQGGNGNDANGSITGLMDDLVQRAIFALNGDNSGWAGDLFIGNTTDGGDVDTQHFVTIGNPLAISANNNVTIRSDATLRTNGNDVVIGSLAAANSNVNNFIENSSITSPGSITITQTTDAAVDVVLRDGETVFILQPGESYQSLSFVKAGSAVLELTKGNSFTGTTTLAGGTLRLAYDADNSMLSDTSALILNDGILDLAGTVDHSEFVLSTILNGTVAIERSAGASIINLETITRNAGSLRIATDDIATTDNTNVNGILGGWATVGSSFATNSGVLGTGGFGNYIRALTTFDQTVNRLGAGNTIADGAADNVTIVEAGASGAISMATPGVTTINTLLQSADGSAVDGPNGPAVVDIGAGNTLRIASGGVLLPDGSSSLTFNPTGTLTAGTGAGGTLFLQSQDTDTNLLTSQKLTVGTVIADDVGVVDVRTTGPGMTVFTGANTYTGETFVGSGILAVGAVDGTGTSGTLGGGATTVEGSAILAFNRADVGLVVTSPLKGAGTVVQYGLGTTTLSGVASESELEYVAVRGTLATGADNAINTTGTLTFGETAGTTETATVDLTNGSATVGGLLVQTNTTTANSLIIGAGKTLTVNGGVLVGVDVNASDTVLNATGGGSLIVNSGGANFAIGGAIGNTNENTAIVDLTGLDNFTANLGAGILRVGDVPNTATGSNASTLRLATNNTINAGTIDVGQGSGAAVVHTLQLGSGTNTINADLINVGSAFDNIRSGGDLLFAGSDTTGAVTIRGSDGITRAAMNVLNTAGGTTNSVTSSVDFSGHTADVLISTLVMAQRSSNNGSATATFSFDQGTLDVAALTMASRTGGGNSGTVAQATLNLGDSVAAGTPTTTIGTIDMGINTANDADVFADINVTGGNVAIGSGSGTAINMANANAGLTVDSNINLTGGTTTVTGNIIRTGGAGTENATITIGDGTGATTGVLDMSGNSIGTATETIGFVAESGTLRNLGELNGGGVLDKTTTGTLLLDTANTYSGGTTVSAGTLLVNNTLGSGTGTGSVTVASGATLGGSGIISGPTNILGGHSPGNSPGIQDFGSDLTYSGGASTLLWELIANTATPGDRGTLFDGLNVGGNLDFAGATAATLTFNSAGSTVDWSDALWGSDQEWLVYQVTGTTSNDSNLGVTTENWLDSNGLGFNGAFIGSTFGFSLTGNNVFLNYNVGTVVPEPSRMVLLTLGVLGVFFRRRRTA